MKYSFPLNSWRWKNTPVTQINHAFEIAQIALYNLYKILCKLKEKIILSLKIWRLDHFWIKEFHSIAVEQSKQLSPVSVLLKYIFKLSSVWNGGCNLVNATDLV